MLAASRTCIRRFLWLDVASNPFFQGVKNSFAVWVGYAIALAAGVGSASDASNDFVANINRDGIMLELRGDKHPLLFRHCVYGERESCTKKVMPIEGQMYRLHLQHAAFSGRLLQV